MNKLKIGVVGCGIISPIHLDAICKNKNVTLSYVCDINEERAKQTAKKYNCDYTLDINELLKNKEIDVVHILTPHYTHFDLAKQVINSGKHCLLEKPMTIKATDAKELVKLSEYNKDVKLGIVFQNRLNTTSQAIKKLIDDNTYGKLIGLKASVTWYRDCNYYLHDAWRGKWATEGGGVLINQAIHTLDLLQWFGGELDNISGSYGTYVLNDYIEVEDTAFMFLNFKNKVRGLLFATNNNATNSSIEMEIVLEKGILILNDGKLYLKNNNEITLLCEDVSATGEKAYWGLGHEMLINNFYESILSNSNNYVSAREAAVSIEILDKFYKHANLINNIKIDNIEEW